MPMPNPQNLPQQRATAGGLYGEYFNNMWLLGDPAISVVDEEVDFAWGAGAVAPPTASSLVAPPPNTPHPAP